MKTRIILLAILNILIWNSETTAQTNYYKESGIIKGDGFTYQCVIGEFNTVAFYNVNNRFTGVPWRYKDGSEISPYDGIGQRVPVVEDSNNGYKIQNAISSVLTDSEKKIIKENYGGINLIIRNDSQTGKCVDVVFEWIRGSCIDSIPPEQFYKMEQEIKRTNDAVPTEAGKMLNYIISSWPYNLRDKK